MAYGKYKSLLAYRRQGGDGAIRFASGQADALISKFEDIDDRHTAALAQLKTARDEAASLETEIRSLQKQLDSLATDIQRAGGTVPQKRYARRLTLARQMTPDERSMVAETIRSGRSAGQSIQDAYASAASELAQWGEGWDRAEALAAVKEFAGSGG